MAIAAEALEGGAVGAATKMHFDDPAQTEAYLAAKEKRAKAAAKPSRKPKATPAASESSDGGGLSLPSPSGAVRAAGRAAGAVSTPRGRGSIAFRVVLAFGAFILALELASYLSGRYFSYSLGKGGKKVQQAAQALELYPGQSATLKLRNALPPAHPTPGVVSL